MAELYLECAVSQPHFTNTCMFITTRLDHCGWVDETRGRSGWVCIADSNQKATQCSLFLDTGSSLCVHLVAECLVK